MIEVTEALNGNVRVSIDHGGRTVCETWKMTVEEAIAEAEEILSRWSN